MNALEAVIRAREMLENVTPLKRDCGRTCGGACCGADEDGQGGMLLFPEEERLYDPLPEGFTILRDDSVCPGARLIVCEGVCDRNARPLSCRLFPLLPAEDGCMMDRRGWAVCPLMEYGKSGLDPAFISAVTEAGRLLYAFPEHKAFLDAIHRYNEQLKKW